MISGRCGIAAPAKPVRRSLFLVSVLASAVQVTHAGDQLSGLTLARREVVHWKSGDGAEIDGILIKPLDFDPTKKYPLLVVIHGGPTGSICPSS